MFVIIACIGVHCGYYSFSGSSLPPHIRTLAIPVFENKTTEFGVPEDITDALINEFTRDNSLKIVDQRTADSIINGTILSIREQAGAYNVTEQVKEIKVFVSVQAKFEDIKKSKVLWEEQLTQWGTYRPDDPTAGNTTRQEAIREAITKIVADIFNKTISGW
ncbi:MAG: LPS assembly lipoprotein LptE [candidate division KSB1 bacterium]|nr:LPS assembly lipoprotein LptE [candidate division KSB1 bacterium]MDZ7319303.1 LPS assembly lipoprotein LptE [candidate division KSB1 bacterium]MDZ7340877.1 LPS assembly lipoprotein LptE [candidate division KSB1 bacterium]